MLANLHLGEDDPLSNALGRIRRTKDFPTISKYLAEINAKLSESTAETSASELANIIVKDYGLTNKLLKLVNSAFYGIVTGKVSTITRAVVLLGYDNVRIAAVSLMLFEHFKRKSSAKDLKDATIRSFWCGLFAKEIAQKLLEIDSEEVFICAMLHQLGKLLTIYHMPLDFEEIKFRVKNEKIPEKQAVHDVLGTTYKSIGLAVAREWNFPESICQTMIPLTAEELSIRNANIDPLRMLSCFADSFADIIATVPFHRRNSAVKHLLGTYKHTTIQLSSEQLDAMMAVCLDKLYQHADALQFSVVESDFMQRLLGPDTKEKTQSDGGAGQHLMSQEPKPPFRLDRAEKFTVDQTVATESQDAVNIILGGIQEISNAMMAGQDINNIAQMSLEVIYRALNCQRALLFIHKIRSKIMEVRYGYGAEAQQFIGKLAFNIDVSPPKDLFSESVQGGLDLFVDNVNAPELRGVIPGWYRDSIDAKAFVFLPVVYQDLCVGGYYMDLDFYGSVINPVEHRYLSMLRNQVILAIKIGH